MTARTVLPGFPGKNERGVERRWELPPVGQQPFPYRLGKSTRNPSKIDAKRGDQFLQPTHRTNPPREPDSFRLSRPPEPLCFASLGGVGCVKQNLGKRNLCNWATHKVNPEHSFRTLRARVLLLPDLRLTCLGRQAQSHFGFPTLPFIVFFLMVCLQVFSVPRPSLAGEHLLFVCAADESKENDK